MKIAGRKNDGAWYRTNKAIQRLSPGAKLALHNLLVDTDTYNDAFNAIVSLGAETGTDVTAVTPDAESWVGTLASTGIPRQVWYGRLSFSTYTRTGATATSIHYVKNYEPAMFAFSKDLRRICKQFFFGRREVEDLVNVTTREQGNPGGIADATLGN